MLNGIWPPSPTPVSLFSVLINCSFLPSFLTAFPPFHSLLHSPVLVYSILPPHPISFASVILILLCSLHHALPFYSHHLHLRSLFFSSFPFIGMSLTFYPSTSTFLLSKASTFHPPTPSLRPFWFLSLSLSYPQKCESISCGFLITAPVNRSLRSFPTSKHEIGNKERRALEGFQTLPNQRAPGVGTERDDGNPVWRVHPRQPITCSHNSPNPFMLSVEEKLFFQSWMKGKQP